jgi:hypothetical protein
VTKRVGIPVPPRLFPGACTPARESEVAPPNPITLRKDIVVICAFRNLNDLSFAPLGEPELDPGALTDGAEDTGAASFETCFFYHFIAGDDWTVIDRWFF